MGIGLSEEELDLEISLAYDEGLESAAVLCENIFPKIHTRASENSDRYHTQDETVRFCAAKIRGLKENK